MLPIAYCFDLMNFTSVGRNSFKAPQQMKKNKRRIAIRKCYILFSIKFPLSTNKKKNYHIPLPVQFLKKKNKTNNNKQQREQATPSPTTTLVNEFQIMNEYHQS